MKRAIPVLMAAALALTIVAWRARQPAPTAAPPAPTPATPAPLPAATARAGCDFHTGQRFDLALDVRSGLELQGSPRTAARLVETDALRATVGLEVLQVAAGHAVLVGRFEKPEAHGQAFSAVQQQPFLVELDRACQLTRFARHADTAPADARQLQATLWELSWRWTTSTQTLQLHNARGAFEATASGATHQGVFTAQHRAERYTQLWELAGQTRVMAFTSVQVQAAPWFEHFESDETLESSVGTLHTRTRADAVPSLGSMAEVDHDSANYVWVDLLPTVLARREALPVTPHDRALQAQVRDETPAQMVARTEAAIAASSDLATSWPPLRAYLEARPEVTAEVVDELKRGHVSPDGLNPFFIALGNARTSQARDALLSVFRDGAAPPTVRARAMFSLVDRADVGPELARELAQTSQALTATGTRDAATTYVAGEALLALSTMSGLHPDDVVRGVALEAIHSQLDQTTNERAQGTALRAMANLGDPALLPDVEPFTRSGSLSVRRAAAHVTRRMRPADTDAFVLPWLARERVLTVKKDLFTTLERQHLDARAPVSEALTRALLGELQREEHAVIARRALLRLVGRSVIATRPEVREVLKAQARRALLRRDGLANEALDQLTPEEIREVAP